ncbi:hypothetical protein OG21DRAFT_1490267 [Imleria badia]|nr:hypothetical protein OG21DRAFT_1490267 [Imleria badia]
MFQLRMLEFFRDMDRYLWKLTGIPPPAPCIPTPPATAPPIIPTPEETPSIPTQTPSASSSPLDSEELVTLARGTSGGTPPVTNVPSALNGPWDTHKVLAPNDAPPLCPPPHLILLPGALTPLEVKDDMPVLPVFAPPVAPAPPILPLDPPGTRNLNL